MTQRQKGSGWRLEAWKAAISLFEKVLLVILGTLFIPVLMKAAEYSTLAIILGLLGVFIFGVGWLILVLRAYFREDADG